MPLSDKETELLTKTFPGRNLGERVRVNISKLYEVRATHRMNRVYKGVRMPDTDREDAVEDISGYIGVFHRGGVTLDERRLPAASMEQLA